MESNERDIKITGTHIAYYFICARKLWLYDHGIRMETESDRVRLGKHIHKNSYQRKKKEIDIDGVIVVDWIDYDDYVIHETKTSNSMERSHRWQLKYYLWYLEQKGMNVADEESTQNKELSKEDRGFIGELNYPRMRKTKQVILSQRDRKKIENELIPKIKRICNLPEPPDKVEWEVCKSCAYCEWCYS
jgi:CRISPR-associated exonuclease Cas4